MASGQRYRLVLAFHGGGYHGWQAQVGLRTVQGELSRALLRLSGESPQIQAAGRTDRGAHAHGQVVAFSLQADAWEPGRMRRALNALLPEDVAVLAVDRAQADFDPRRQAWRRSYRDRVRDSEQPAPVTRGQEWRVNSALELLPMRQAARRLVGRQDFAAFGSSPRPGGSTGRTVDRATVARAGGLICLEVRADAFLRGMMRNFAGALVAIGRRRAELADLAAALACPSPGRALWATAPALGLHQWRVEYRGPEEAW